MTKHYISMSKLSLLIAFSLIMMGNLSKAQKQKAVETAGTQVFPWTNDQSHELKNEIVDKRSQFSKHYQLANGNQRMYSSIGSIHYKNGNTWNEISKEIKSNTTSTHTSNPYYNGTNSFKTYYPQNPFSGKVYTSLHEGEMNENIESVYAIDQNGNIVYQFQANSTQEISVENASIVYNNVFPSTSIRYSQGSDGRKFDIVLQNQQSLNNIPTNAAYLVIKEKVTIPSGWSVKTSSNGIDIYKGSNWLANLPTPIAFEQESANKTYENETEAMTKGEMTMSKNGNEITLYTKFSMDWLKSSSRSFPIFLDPTLTIYPLLTAMNTGYMLNVPGLPLPSPAAPKFSGNIRITAGGTVAWCKFPLTTLPANAAITSASYNGYHYNGVVPVGLPFKYASIIGMQNVDPVTADSFSIYNKIINSGPIYNNNYLFGKDSINKLRTGSLNGTALTDIAAQQSQGWTALGFKIATGYLNAQLHYGINGTTLTYPYLLIDYTSTICAAAPTAGNATASVASACALPFTLDLTGNTIDSGLTYQWQSSPAGLGTWTNLGSVQNSPALSTTQTSATDYQCIVTCTGAGLSSTSALVAVAQAAFATCYCTPSGSGTTASTWFITGFSTTLASPNISNLGTAYSPGGYSLHTTTFASAVPGTSFNFNMTFAGGSQNIGMWIDWNQDGDFNDASENPILTTVAITTGSLSGSIAVPLTAIPGDTKLRIRNISIGTAQNCGAFANSETEDYTFNVIGGCTTAGTASLVVNGDTICPLTTKLMTATVSPYQLGVTYQWKESMTSGGPYTDIPGATNTTYTTIPLPAGTYYYVFERTCAGCGPCSVLSNEHSILSQDVVAPTGFNSAQCAPGVATAYVTSNNPVIGTGNFNWYATPTSASPLQARPYGPLQPCYFNDFSSATLPSGTTLQTTASITGGVLQLFTPSTNNVYGAIQVNGCNYNSDKYQVDFDFNTVGTPANMADGFSYNFCDNGLITNEATALTAENGTGGRLHLCFVAYPSGGSPAGIYLYYGTSINEVTPISTLGGGLGYSPEVSWRGVSGNHVTLNIDSLGKVTVLLTTPSLGTVTLFNNLALPASAAYATANRSNWKHIWKGRTGAINMGVSLDNIQIQQSTLITGSPTYLTPVSTTTTFYVAELGTNGCFSPRTPVTVTVNTPPTITASATPNDSVCTGAPVTLSGSGATTYLWNGNTTTVNGDTTFSNAVAGIYTITGTDANSCTNTATILVYLHPVLSGSATATPSSICLGDSSVLDATATPICTGLYSPNFGDYYTPTLWTFDNLNTNGTSDFTGAPANVKLSTGTAGASTGGLTSFSRVITCTGNITFNWSFMHPLDAYADLPRYSINGGALQDFPTYNIGAFGATQTGSMSIPVLAGDSLSIIVETIDNDGFAGMLTITNFVAPSPKINGLISFFDQPAGGTNLGTPPLTVTPTSTGAVTYYAEITSSTTGCPNLNREPVTLQVNALPTATVTGGGTVCAGATLPDINIAFTGIAPWTFTLDDGTATTNITTSTNPYIISNAAAGTYSVSNFADANCTGTNSGTASVIVNALPTAIVSGGGTVCAGATLPDVNIDLTGASPWTITYTDGTTPVTVNNILTSPYIISNAAAGNYSVTNVNDNNCIGTSSGTANVVINALPAVSASASTTNTCNNTTVTLNGANALSYVWSNGVNDGLPYVINTTTTYTVTGTDANTCSSATTITVNVVSASSDLSNATLANASSTPGNNSGTDNQLASSLISYYSGACNLIASINSTLALGTTTSTVNVDATISTHNGQPFVARWFQITPTVNTGASVIFYLTQDDFDDYNTYAIANSWPLLPTNPLDASGIANLRITKNDNTGLGNNPVVLTPNSVTWNASTNYWSVEVTVPGFSQFRFHASNPLGSALSVDIKSFTGKKELSYDVLSWTTSTEQNNDFFNLQHSTNGTQFTTIDKVNTKAQGGNSASPINYESVHLNPVLGHNYYRLEQVDINGKKSINAKIIDLIWSENGSSVNIYPNPAREFLNIDLTSNQASNTLVKIMDMSGRVVKQVEAKTQKGINNLSISLKELSSGVYTIQILENGKISFIERVRKD